MKKPLIILALIAALAAVAYGVETTLASLPANTFAAPATTMDQAHVDAVNAIVSAQNANNTSLRAGIAANTNSVLTTPTITNPTVSTGTFTTPTLNNPVIKGPAPVACGATCSATAGQLILLDQGTGSVVTIPAATGTGNVVRMRITTATASAADKVLLTTVTDTIIGTASGFTGSTAKIFVGNAGTYHSLQMPNAGSQPSGGFVGDAIVCTDIASTIWACDVQYQGGTTPTTPYSTSTT
ncbi:MAG: hypothetical protein V4502_08055 [Pseudomonadota bacterium]